MSDYSLPRIKESELPEATSIDKVRVLDNAGNSVWVEKENFSLPASQISVSSESVEATTVDTAIDELSLDIQNFDESKENVSNKSQDINESPEDSQAYPSNPAVKTYVDTADALKADKATQIIAGAGLTGGGDLSSNRTINVVSADDGITVNADNIKLNIVNDLVTTSATRALSATQGKKLQDEKEALVNKSTDIVADTGSSEKYPSVVATEAYATPRYDNEAIDLDNLGDVRARSIDVDNLPKICGFDMFVISTTAPSVAPDFIPQIWVDTTAKKAYIAVGVSTSADFIALN
jgi:hypothetical protein